MTSPQDTPVVPATAEPEALPRPEEEVADAGDPRDQPVAGGTADGPAAQGDGAPDSY